MEPEQLKAVHYVCARRGFQGKIEGHPWNNLRQHITYVPREGFRCKIECRVCITPVVALVVTSFNIWNKDQADILTNHGFQVFSV
jgi:hypothetical protein